VRPSHLLDREVADAWAARDPEVRPTVANPRPRHAAAQPVMSGGRLRVITTSE